MRREYIILFLIIILSGAYLFLRKDNLENYDLPQIKQLDTAEISELFIETNQESIKFFRENKKWFVSDKKYPADRAAVDNILSTLKNLKLSLLVSQNQDLQRYELEPENRISVRALKDGKSIFEFYVGKTAPSYNHTYIMLQNDTNIYQADGNFRTNFDKTLQNFRDKIVLEFQKDSVKKIIIKKDEKRKTLTRTKQKKEENEKPEIVWSADDGKAVDSYSLDRLLSDLSLLKCQSFPENISKEELEKQSTFYQITLENNTQINNQINLSLFVKIDEEKKDNSEDKIIVIRGLCSMTPYVFELSQSNSKNIVDNIESLLGIN